MWQNHLSKDSRWVTACSDTRIHSQTCPCLHEQHSPFSHIKPHLRAHWNTKVMTTSGSKTMLSHLKVKLHMYPKKPRTRTVTYRVDRRGSPKEAHPTASMSTHADARARARARPRVRATRTQSRSHGCPRPRLPSRPGWRFNPCPRPRQRQHLRPHPRPNPRATRPSLVLRRVRPTQSEGALLHMRLPPPFTRTGRLHHVVPI